MPDITATSLFPSLKFIATDGSGNLLESESIDAKKAKKIVEGLTVEAVNAGVAGNDIQFGITSDNSTGSIAFTKSGDVITLNLGGDPEVPAVPAAKSSKVIEGITFTAAAAGVSGDDIEIELIENQGGTDTVSESGSKVTISLSGNASASDADTVVALDYTGLSLIDQPTGSGSSPLTAFAATKLDDGSDLVPSVPAVDGKAKHDLDAIVSAFAGASNEIKNLVDITGSGSANISSNLAASNLAEGEEEIAGELDPSENYLLIKQADLHDLSNDEHNDGRKLIWGFINKASDKLDALPNQPDSLRIIKGVPTSTDGGTALKQTYTITAKYAISGLDLKAEA